MKRQSATATIIELAMQGLTTQQIQEQVGCPMQTIYSALHTARKAGKLGKIDPVREQQKQQLLDSIKALLAQGLGSRAIAAQLGTTRGKVAYAIEQAQQQSQPVHCVLDTALLDSIRKRLTDGLDVSAIANEIGKSKETIRHCMREARRQGIEMPYAPTRTKPKKAPNELFYMRYVQRLTLEEISRRKGISVNSLWRFFMNRPVVELVREQKPYTPTEITPAIEQQILSMHNRERYNVTAIAEQLGTDLGETMEIVRQDKLCALRA